MKNNYIFEYLDENDFRKKERGTNEKNRNYVIRAAA